MIAALVAGGCGKANATPSGPPALRPSEVQVCRGFGNTLLDGVTVDPAKGRADYLELREEPRLLDGMTPPAAADGGVAPSPAILGKTGRPCASASDKPKCELALRAIRSGQGFTSRSTGSGMAPTTMVTYLVANFGDRFVVATTEDELRRLIAPFDTTNDVELVAGCGRMLKTAAGWDVTRRYTDTGDCHGGTSGWQRFGVSVDGVVKLTEDHAVHRPPTCISGRRPDGLVPCARNEGYGSLADFFAQSAHLEEASVVAFERLADELSMLGAPVELVDRARRSRDDETRHADVMNGLARRLGIGPRELEIAPMQTRSAFAIALENAVEGCIRETYGALVAHYQSRAAESSEVRDAMRAIAEDETTHASLAWDIAAWLEPRLSNAERKQLHGARVECLRELSLSLERPPSEELLTGAGVPGPREAKQLLAGLAHTLAPALQYTQPTS